ncbi:hypothetical protein [Marinovum sp.]|uniref:hypothetical protein n=1 Tax=Marinovum sp. TaxID=2024839 RepID=UPI002B26FE68|nr:hypothetical protein [Marinovum sp.]
MKPFLFALPPALLLLAACDETTTQARPIAVMPLPESVRELAAPGQDLSTAYLRREDGCFWYRYDGPVETTDLPLRATGGAPICTRRSVPAETPAAS